MISTLNQSRLALAWLVLAGIPAVALANDPPKNEKPAETKKSAAFDPVEIRIFPRPAPTPALKYRLFPLEPDRTPGDAAPIYIRLGVGIKNTDPFHKKVLEWILMPPDKFPLDEARKLVDEQRPKLDQLAFGARRQTCDWNYTLPEQREDSIQILLPDAQDMRNWMRLLQLKVRVEIAEKKYEEAIRTLETGIAFGRHIGEGPFLINTLIGIAGANVMLAKVEELIAQPGAPNLYWALSALPQPLVPIRAAMEIEQQLGERIVPEITDLDRPRTEGEWSALLARLHARLMRLQKTSVAKNGDVIPVGQDTTLAQFVDENLADAKAYYKSRQHSTEGMSDAQILVCSIADRYHELRDDWFKLSYLPYPDIARFDTPAKEVSRMNEKGPLAIFAAIMPAVVAAKSAETRIDRKVAAIRIIEALRMFAAAKNGSLPDSLDEIELAPIPLDPVTGKPFAFTRAGETATLSGPPPAARQPGLTYRITLKK